MTAAHVLVVDDEADIRELLEITLVRMGLRTHSAGSLKEARDLLAEHTFNLCLTDMRLPDGSGVELIAELQRERPGLPAAVITAYGNAQAAVESLRAGAFDFVEKPVDVTKLRKLVDAALKLPRKNAAPVAGPAEVEGGGLLGRAQSIEHLRSMIERLARSQAPVHISGESGTGKELVARLIHSRSPRAEAAFVPVNCGAIPSELMESEFFGHLKGSFTGATRDKTGLFQAAEGGTLFLDEVGDLPLHMQVKLLRAVQERSIRPIGAEKEIPINVRIVSATHKDIGALVGDGSFRQDLYYRLNVVEVRVPPLRERSSDIPLLAEALLKRLAGSSGMKQVPRLDAAAKDRLLAYHFPGNVRELENILERALTLCDGDVIGPYDLELRGVKTENADAGQLDEHLEEIERKSILEALEKARYNKTKAAVLLGMSFRSLRYRIKKLGIE